MLECKICGTKFNAIIERHYIARDNEKTGLAVAFGSTAEESLYDTFDCPMCGCQVIAKERKRDYIPFISTDEEDADMDEGISKVRGEEKTPSASMMTRSETLDKAKACVCGQRENEYGSPEDNFTAIAGFWSVYKGVEFTANDVAMMMALLKIARIRTGTATDDSYVDLAGYAACGAEINSKN